MRTVVLPTPTPSLVPSGTPAATGSPSPSSSLGAANPLDAAEEACRQGGSTVCRLVVDLTGNVRVGAWVDVLVGTPFRIACIVLLGLIARFLLHRVLDRIADRIATGRTGLGRLDERLPSATALLATSPLLSARREQRARTMASVLRSVVTGVVGGVVILMIIDELGFPTTPLLASASILGVAVGFGSQAIVKDFLSGILMIIEDQYGVGDVVDLGEASGVVEAVGLRVTRVRDVDGTVWYIRNGEVLRVGNRSQGWARAVLDVGIAYGEDVGRAESLLLSVAQDLREDEHFGPLVLEEPEMWGVESVSAEGVVLRLVVKTQPLEQWAVARELRRRIKERLDREGIAVAHPQPAVWVTGDAGGRARTASADDAQGGDAPAARPPGTRREDEAAVAQAPSAEGRTGPPES